MGGAVHCQAGGAALVLTVRTVHNVQPDASTLANQPVVSIVIPTCNRLLLLRRCIEAVRAHVTLDKEVIVVDGASADGTGAWLAGQSGLRVITESAREGPVRAFDKGFRAASGTYLCWLNDDTYPLPGAVQAAVDMIERPDLADVGLVAFYHDFDRERNRLDDVWHEGRRFSVYNVRGYPYANFGLMRRELLVRLGYLDLRYRFAAWDPDLSLKVQLEAGLKVAGCRRAFIVHDELMDARKEADLAHLEADNALLFEKWKLPPRDSYPDPGPAYRAFLRQRGLC